MNKELMTPKQIDQLNEDIDWRALKCKGPESNIDVIDDVFEQAKLAKLYYSLVTEKGLARHLLGHIEALKDLYENRFEPDKLHILIPKYYKELGPK